ncbi:MAG: response regulator [Prevotella sp.]|jgi:signal transduction histidine kinase/ligand-binding sensor domain-containing protein/DNA-binding response OmpR family regulator|nr:response regulator [Prevotella sp.]
MPSPKKIVFALLLSILVLVADICAQDLPAFRFRKIDVDDGLSENTGGCILQDSRGFMWFGTKDGLNRYDGTGFKVYANDPDENLSLGNNYICSLLQGKSDIMYVGTSAGLYIMHMSEDKFTKLNNKTADGTEVTSAINGMLLDEEDRLWLVTLNQGIFVFDTNKNILRKINIRGGLNSGSDTGWCIMSDRSGVIWVGTRMGLLRYNSNTEQLEPVLGLSGHIPPKNEVMSITEDDKGRLWLGTWDEGVRIYNKHTGSYITYGNKDSKNYITHIRAIYPYSGDIMLVGSDDGLYAINDLTSTLEKIDIPRLQQNLNHQTIHSIAGDREGGLWVGTYSGGINYLNTLSAPVDTYIPDNYPYALLGRIIGQFCEDASGNLWIATEDGGVNYLDVKTKKISQPVKTSYRNIQALLLDGDKLWIGTMSRGLDIYDLRDGSINNIRHNPADEHSIDNDCIFSLYKTDGGDIYVGTSDGLNRYDQQNHNFVRIPEAKGLIRDIKEDEYGYLWLASLDTGAKRMKIATEEWVHYDTLKHRSNPIVGQKLSSIYIDDHKNLIFSSQGSGIFMYDYLNDDFRNISQADGLPNNVIYGILDDQFGNLWLSSNVGIICFNPDSPQDYRLYNKEDGMQSAQFNFRSSYKTRNGKFYFGGINGFSSFYPDELLGIKNRVVPPVVITEIKPLGNIKAEMKDEITTSLFCGNRIELPYHNSSFTISYVSLSYMAQSKNMYTYMLEGSDTEWNYVGNNKSVTYLNLPPGEYTFRVKGSNNDGLWNEQAAHIEIHILPPFWRSTPAIILYILLVSLLCYLLVTYYLRRYRRKQAVALEAIMAEEEKKNYQSKLDFFTTIAHEIRTPLSLISAPLEEIIASKDGNEQTHQNLSIIEKNSERLSTLINQLLDFRKIDSRKHILTWQEINMKRQITEIYERFCKTAQSKDITLSLKLPEDERTVITDSDALIKITGNLLTNALKFTSDLIILQLQYNQDNSYTISVTDNGKGIPDNQKKVIFDPFFQINKEDDKQGIGIGLSLVKSLSDMLEGSIEVFDVFGGGTTFAFRFNSLPAALIKEEIPSLQGEESSMEGKPHLLVVDDNKDMASFISSALNEVYSVDIAYDAAQAMELLEKDNYELIVLDIMMPGIDGISLVGKLKKDINYSHIPIILLSAKTDNASKAEGLHSGADVFIEKPFSVQHLKAQISSLLNNRKSILEAFNRSPLMPYSTLAMNKSDESFLKILNDEIKKNMSDEDFSVESLADILSISRSNLQRKVKVISGMTPGEYLRNYRLRKACQLLIESNMRINEVAFEVGFSSASYFNKVFYKAYNMTPTEFIASHIADKE